MEESQVLGKQKAHEDLDATLEQNSSFTPNSESEQKQQPNLVRICVHEVVVPTGSASSKDESVHGTLSNPIFNGTEAKLYPFNLDPLQQVSVACLKRNKSVLVSAHTSADGLGLYLVVVENEQFKEDCFVKLQDTFAKQKKQGDGNKSQNANSSGRIVKNGTSFGGSDIYKIVKFAIGLNMPAQTVVFTSLRKWNGDSHRIIGSGKYIQALPDIGERVSKLEKEADMLDASREGEFAEYHKLILDIAQLEKKMMSKIIRPERVLYFLLPGRLVSSIHSTSFFVHKFGSFFEALRYVMVVLTRVGGVVVNVVKKSPTTLGNLPSAMSAQCGSTYILDTLLHCSPGSSENGSRPRPCPPSSGEKGKMHVVPVQLPLISVLSKIRINVPSDLRPMEAKQNVLLAVQELATRFSQGFPKLNPVKDKGIEDPEFVQLVNQIEELEKKLFDHPLQKLQKFRDKLKNRSRVLKKLGHIDADGAMQLKGWVACLIDTEDELLITGLMFNGIFNDLDHHQVAALSSCFILVEKSNEQIHLRTELGKPLQQLQENTMGVQIGGKCGRVCRVNRENLIHGCNLLLVKGGLDEDDPATKIARGGGGNGGDDHGGSTVASDTGPAESSYASN
ncbi:hypothetical protein GIB67_039766 [Kingdonia uniflora]|uniref:ATP-dependent RNA helicase Ski2/MTR4 C-terminal domain-containing protein n=1 Tax=Kingdonia uniflora TaxID=39325 RepID=A0A7J7MPY7_9MAGN|nr:hypothetical protein GIB67_039766 [Kingdonia uniflora]